ncbi:MAG: hypothetical protein ACREND_12075, partial [Gemmatimonadaceae bacterium]
MVRVRTAEAQAELDTAAVVRTAAEGGDWKAAAWMLSRKHPDRWSSRREREDRGIHIDASHHTTVNDYSRVPQDVRALVDQMPDAGATDAEIAAWARRVLKGLGSRQAFQKLTGWPDEFV